jgi:ABC-type glycerol-3-phosphate transport system substrate-binding protein
MNDKKVSRRDMLRMTALISTGMVVAGCAAPTQAPAAQQPTKAGGPTTAPASQEPETLTLWDWDETSLKFYQSQIDRWNEVNTGKPKLKFDGVLVPDSGEVVNKGMNALAANSGVPNCFQVEISLFSKFLKGKKPLAEDYLVDMVSMLDMYNANWKNDYIGFAPYTWNGKVYAFENGLCPTAYYYRKDLFDAAGITMPLETWEDWMIAGEKMKAAGHAMCAFDTTGLNEFIMEFYQAGGQLFDGTGKLTVEEERAYKSLELIISAAKSGVRWPTEGYWGAPHYAALNDGTVAGVISAIWYSPFVLKTNVKNSSGNWRVQPMPAWAKSGAWGGPNYDTRKTSTWGGTGMTIPRQSTHPQLTFDWMAFAMLTKEGASDLWKIMQQMPMVKSVIHDGNVTNVPDEYYGGQAINKVFADLADQIPPKYPAPFWNEAEQALNKIIAPAMAGEDTYEKLIKKAADEYRKTVATE